MPRRIDPDPTAQRTLSTGRCYVYVLPCAYEDILKLGHSREPLRRMQALHPRYFEFFDLDQAVLVEFDTVREARAAELRLGRAIQLHNAPAPLVIRREAAGHREWYRGALELLACEAMTLSEAGHRVCQGLRPWLRERLRERGDALFGWASQVEEQAGFDPSSLLPRYARDALDAYTALEIDVEPLLPVTVWRRYRRPAE